LIEKLKISGSVSIINRIIFFRQIQQYQGLHQICTPKDKYIKKPVKHAI